MAFKDFPEHRQGVQLLQRSLERGRLAHAYLFNGHELEDLEAIASALIRTLNCQRPVRGVGQAAVDCCDQCANCRKIAHGNHADVHWVRPESRSRVVTVDQTRALMQEINLKPAEADYKAAVIVAADRMNVQAANAFLKTLEEPPAKSVLILLSTEPQRMLETILSRCLRLNFAGEGSRMPAPAEMEWLAQFGGLAAATQTSLLQRYRLLDALMAKLNRMKEATEESLAAQSPLQQYDEVEKDLRERWESELSAAIEAEYRRQRADLLVIVQRWFRDVWLQTLPAQSETAALLDFPQMDSAKGVARRLSSRQALENLQIMESLQRLLRTNVQEALALEVNLLKLQL